MSGPHIEETEPPEVSTLRAEGFVPIEELTGQVERGTLWPSSHRRVLTDWRYEPDPSDDGVPGLTDGGFYMLRSPWPSVTPVEAMAMLDRWVRRHRPNVAPGVLARIDTAAEDAQTRVFLAQDEGWIRAYREGHIRPTRPRDQ